MKSLLVIGGSSFLGKAILEQIPDGTFAHVGFTSQSKKSHPRFSTHILDLNNADQVKKVCKEYEIILNCSGQIGKPFMSCLKLNTVGICNLINTVKATRKKLIQISSANVYGSAGFVSESTIMDPDNVYAAAKASAEALIQHFLPQKNYLIICLSNLYGEEQSKGLIYYLLHKIKKSSKLHFDDNDGSLTRFFLHKDDAAANIIKLIEANAEGRINLFGPDKLSIRELVREMKKSCGKKIVATYVEKKPIGNIDKVDETQLKQTIKPVFRHSIRDFLFEQCKKV